jgi:hypothetical protein
MESEAPYETKTERPSAGSLPLKSEGHVGVSPPPITYPEGGLRGWLTVLGG